MNIKLKNIDKTNWTKCYKLKVNKEQENFVAPNGYSMLEALYEEDSDIHSMGIYDGDEMVGYTLCAYDRKDCQLWMCRLMIDKKYQHNGYGSVALDLIINYMKEKYGDIDFYTSFEPDNHVAEKLYESKGFKKNGEIIEGEVVMVNKLTR